MTRVGILGAGQLAMMLAEAAAPLGTEVVCAGSAGDCAGRVARVAEVDLTDAAAVARFAATVDLVTVESENIDAAVLGGLPLYPNARAIGIAQDRLFEKTFLNQCGLPTAPFAVVSTREELATAVETIGTPAILKTRRMGYDGRGQFRLHSPADADAAWAELGASAGAVPCILEGFVTFTEEVSLLAVRGVSGEVRFWPLVQNFHRDGILRTSLTPFVPLDSALQRAAERHVDRLLREMDYIGVLAVEFFLADGELVANEMAPRVHNSGHWTIEGSEASQFTNHLCAITGLPLRSTASRPMAMLNCIGVMPPLADTAQFPSLFRHDYGKEFRPHRKVGHLTFERSAEAEIREWQRRVEAAG